jgi:hypothetical protein
VTPLHRALALEQVDDVAVRIGTHLDLHVPRALDEALHIQRAVPEGGGRLAARRLQRVAQAGRVAHHLHADTAAAGRWLDEHGEADAVRRGGQRFVRLIVGGFAGHHRNAGRFHDGACADLRSHALDGVGRGPHEDEPRLLHGARELRTLREKPVAGMDGVGAS